MSIWHELTTNPEAIRALWDAAPSLRDSRLTRLALDWNGPMLSIHALLADFPDRPPARWAREGHDAVALQLDLMGLEAIAITRWTAETLADLTVERLADGLIRVRAEAPGVDLDARGQWLRIAHVTGYAKER